MSAVAQFKLSLRRWTTGYGEPYDYNSIMHYSATAFSRTKAEGVYTIVPKKGGVKDIGRKVDLSKTDVAKIKKMYKCKPYAEW